jgi:hypothetical protein
VTIRKGIDVLPVELRQKLTRAVCWIALVGNATIALSAILILINLFFFPPPRVDGILAASLVLFPIAVAGQIASIALWAWRVCDRCAFRLFPLIAGNISSLGHLPPMPDYRAERFWGSYHWGALVSMATKGIVHCARCGHEDGVRPDYIVTNPH